MNAQVDFSRGPRAVAALRVAMAMEVAAIAGSAVTLLLLRRLAAGEAVDDAQLNAIDLFAGLVGIATIVVLVVTAVLFIRWLAQARRNAEALGGRGMVHAPAWAVWGWFVPILNLFRPYEVVGEIWRASEPGPDRRSHPLAESTPPFMRAWWAAWLIGGFLSQLAFRMHMRLSELSGLAAFMAAEWVLLAATLASLAAAVLATRLVRELDQRQRARAIRLADEAQPSVEPVLL